MRIKELPIDKVNDKPVYLTDVLPQIPTNTILYKTLTGLGATYSELKAQRHSIILEPNIPVIVGKCSSDKHKEDNLFGVFEGVSIEKIMEYLKNSKDKYYKIVTTPESFTKVKDAFLQMELNMYSTCFTLYDEVHKIIKDVDYREDIVLPMDDFFQFKNKALVSATPIEFSDPRFEEQGFQVLKIVPQFEYSQPIKIHPTNNILLEFKNITPFLPHFYKSDKPRPFFVFTNSIDVIYSMMKQLGLLDKSSVFCAPKSMDKLKQNGFTNCHDTWSNDKMSEYNFLTSRFFNALDIELDIEPFVILLTDVYFAEQTMLDPYSDSIQIIGRFRNGVASIHHFSNFRYELPERSKEDILEFIKSSEDVYNVLTRLYNQATTKGSRNAYMAAIESLPFNQFLTKEKEKNYFAIDNYLNEALVTSYYRYETFLAAAYDNIKQTEGSVYYEYSEYLYGDDEKRIKRELKVQSIQSKRKMIVAELKLLGDCSTQMEQDFKQELRKADSFIVDAYDTLGKETIEELKYSYPKIKEVMILAQYVKGAKGTETLQLIKNSFKVGEKYKLDYIKDEIKRIYKLMNVTPPNAVKSNTINDYFVTKKTWIKGKHKGLLIVREK